MSKSKNIEEWRKYLQDNQPLIIATHHDADGIYSGALFSRVFEIKEVRIPEDFQDYGYERINEAGKKISKEHVGLDLGQPISKEFDGVAFDHHEHIEPWYHLVHRRYPTGLIIYEVFKDEIPPEEKWKVVGSLIGDGSPEFTPTEIWDTFGKVLFERRARVYPKYKVNPNVYRYFPIYRLLSSPVNACCRAGYPLEAYKIVRNAKVPTDIIEHPTFKEMEEEIRNEEKKIWEEFGKIGVVKLSTEIHSFIMGSKYKMSGRIASKLRNMDNDKTWIVVNNIKGEISIRGELASFVSDKLSNSEFKLGGHRGYVGGKLQNTQTAEDFINALRKVL